MNSTESAAIRADAARLATVDGRVAVNQFFEFRAATEGPRADAVGSFLRAADPRGLPTQGRGPRRHGGVAVREHVVEHHLAGAVSPSSAARAASSAGESASQRTH